MARLTDHDVRDAEDAARKELALLVGQYTRRMAEMAKAYIQEEIESSIEEETINGIAIGRRAAERAAFPYFGGIAGERAHTVAEGRTNPALNA